MIELTSSLSSSSSLKVGRTSWNWEEIRQNKWLQAFSFSFSSSLLSGRLLEEKWRCQKNFTCEEYRWCRRIAAAAAAAVFLFFFVFVLVYLSAHLVSITIYQRIDSKQFSRTINDKQAVLMMTSESQMEILPDVFNTHSLLLFIHQKITSINSAFDFSLLIDLLQQIED